MASSGFSFSDGLRQGKPAAGPEEAPAVLQEAQAGEERGLLLTTMGMKQALLPSASPRVAAVLGHMLAATS